MMTEARSSHDTYRPFMIQQAFLNDVDISTTHQQSSPSHQHVPRKKPSRPMLPSAVLSYDDRATWGSPGEYQKRNSSSSSSQHHDNTHSCATWQPAWNAEYEEGLQSETGSINTKRHHHNTLNLSYSDQTHNTSTDLLHHYDQNARSEKEEDLKHLWDVASSLLTRPASTYSCTVDMTHTQLIAKQTERRQKRISFAWTRTGKPASPPSYINRIEQELDPESIAQGIVECTYMGKRASTATAFTWRGLLPSPHQKRLSETFPKSSSPAEKSFSDCEQFQIPKTRYRWHVVIICLILTLISVSCIVLGCLLYRNGGDWRRLVS